VLTPRHLHKGRADAERRLTWLILLTKGSASFDPKHALNMGHMNGRKRRESYGQDAQIALIARRSTESNRPHAAIRVLAQAAPP
jgi:hypothetical protein